MSTTQAIEHTEESRSTTPHYCTSQEALDNFATGNPHFDCLKFDCSDVPYLCYLAKDRDAISAEAALNRLRILADPENMTSDTLRLLSEAACYVRLGSDDARVRAAAEHLLQELREHGMAQQEHTQALSMTTGNPEIDQKLSSVVSELRATFGEALQSTFLVGSIADRSQVETSDIDLHVLFKGGHSEYRNRALRNLEREVSTRLGLDLDIIGFSEADITPWADVRTKLGGIQIEGTTSAEGLCLPPTKDYVRENMHRVYYYLSRVRGLPELLTYPVTAPDATCEYFGYAQRRHTDGTPSTKELVVVAGWISTALASLEGSCYISSKSASLRAYLEHVGDEWSSHLQEIFELVREKWQYRIPETCADRAKLSEICRRQIEFENHFLGRYREFLKREAKEADPHAASVARARLGAIFPTLPNTSTFISGPRLCPLWQMSHLKRNLTPSLLNVDQLIVKVPGLRQMSEESLREAFRKFDEYGVVIFACRDTCDLKHDLLGLEGIFGKIVFHPRSDATGITSVRNEFNPIKNFVGTTNTMQTLHTDGSFLDSPPAIVALQAEICGLCGGESTLVFGDSLLAHLKKQFPEQLPKLFDPHAYTVERDGDMASRPVFWHENGATHLAYRCGNGEKLTISPRTRQMFYEVYNYVNAPENQLRFRLPTNHVMVIDNRRNLHGRHGWPSDTVRSLNRLWLDGESTHPLFPTLGIRS